MLYRDILSYYYTTVFHIMFHVKHFNFIFHYDSLV